MTKANKPRGYVIYSGPSLIDGQPIIAVALPAKSRNTKTGGMLQTYIIRADIDPRDASKSGADFSICGSCPHRGIPSNDPSRKQAERRSCYVLLGQGPRMVYQGYVAGQYVAVEGHAAIADIGRGRRVRLGTYGDPAAVPSYVWESLISAADGHTAYSHQSGMSGADVRPDMFMMSADTLETARTYWAEGKRTFRVISDVSEVQQTEVICPASEEGGRRTQCERCGLCAGSVIAAKSIAIVAHGAGRSHAAANVQ